MAIVFFHFHKLFRNAHSPSSQGFPDKVRKPVPDCGSVVSRDTGRMRSCCVVLTALCLTLACARSTFGANNAVGKVTDPQGIPVINATVTLIAADGKSRQQTTSTDGQFAFLNIPLGIYALTAALEAFESAHLSVVVGQDTSTINIQLKLAVNAQKIRISSDVLDVNVLSPDPAQRLLIRQETLDANPGRPGAPVSIPGLPIETASGGIKAPQYFAPGVAGDHGEPIASYIQVGSYLVSNNLSSNAHGNGYADPNILIPQTIGSVQVDGGAFNVREGNHSQNLSATYGLRSQFDPFITVTGDYRDIDAVAGFSPDPHSWILGQAS
jgi:carboxypeptidase family protein